MAGMEPWLKIDPWALAKDPHCGQPLLWAVAQLEAARCTCLCRGERPAVQARD